MEIIDANSQAIKDFYKNGKKESTLSEMQENYLSSIRNNDPILSRILSNENYALNNGPYVKRIIISAS